MERPVEKQRFEALESGARSLGLELPEDRLRKLDQFLELLLAWNRKISLTSVSDPLQAVEVHLVDSLGALPAVRGAKAVLDLGAGGGLPGIPLAIVLPETRFVLVDSIGKKVGFLKAAIAQLGLANARALQVRANGRPEEEGIEKVDFAICRAFLAPAEWLALAKGYVEPGGRIAAMIGAETDLPPELASDAGVELERVVEYRLPVSGAHRRVPVFKGR